MSKVIVVGGGFSGVVAAIYASRNNEVTILERNNDILKKVLITGNGRCNFYNVDQSINHYHSSNEDLLKYVINDKTLNELEKFYKNIGIISKIKDNCYYPFSNKATSIVDALKNKVKELNINVINNYLVEKIEKTNKFIINDDLTCDKLIVSTGSMAYPKTGSDGLGYNLLTKLGHNVNKVMPALASLKSDNKVFKKISGVRCDATISLYEDDKLLKKEEGNLQITDDGTSGICVFNLSYLASKSLNENKNVYAYINFLPFIKSKEEFIKFIFDRNKLLGSRKVNDMFDSLLDKKLTKNILNINKKFGDLDLDELDLIYNNLIKFKVKITKVNSFDNAQICMGGIPLNEINLETMESKIVKNLFITGELLDCNGDCGGYNLTFAFITGYLSGVNI